MGAELAVSVGLGLALAIATGLLLRQRGAARRLAVQNRELSSELQAQARARAERAAQWHGLQRMLGALQRAGDGDDLLLALLQSLQSLVPAADTAALLLREAGEGAYRALGAAEDASRSLTPEELRESVLPRAVALQGEALLLRDPDLLALKPRLLGGEPARALLLLRLGERNAPSALLLLANAHDADAFDAPDGELFDLLRHVLQVALARIAAERTLRRAQEQAGQATRFRTVFLANISHEVRTPMNAVLGFARLGETVSDLDQARDYLRKIGSAGETLLALVDDVLDLSKLEAGRLELEPEHIDLPAALGALRRRFEARAAEKGLGLELSLAPGLPQYVFADARHLLQMLGHLVANALRFTERGGIAIEAGPAADGARGWLEFVVSDSGIGLDLARLESYFEAFGQGAAGIERRQGGTGIGLPLARGIARLMGGDIQVESSPGSGSRFVVRLPWRAGEARLVAAAAAPVAQRLAALRGLRVLLVEDNAINQEVASRMLARVGVEVEIAGDGEAALACARAARFDAVLMDLHMPGMDGFETTSRLRRLPGMDAVPIIALTAHAVPGYRERCLIAGMVDYLTKPVEPAALYHALLRWTGARDAALDVQAVAAATDVAPPMAPATAPLALPGFDVEGALRRLGGDAVFYRRLLDDFLDDFGDIDSQLSVAMEGGDAAGARRLAHAFKGVAATLGATGLAATSAEMERALADDDIVAAALLLPGFQAEFDAARDALRALPPAPEETPAPGPLTAREVEALLDRLQDGLSRSDPTSEDLWDAVRPHLDGVDAAVRDRLDGEIRAFAFGFAQQTLATLRAARR